MRDKSKDELVDSHAAVVKNTPFIHNPFVTRLTGSYGAGCKYTKE
jgi:hypothetical protein